MFTRVFVPRKVTCCVTLPILQHLRACSGLSLNCILVVITSNTTLIVLPLPPRPPQSVSTNGAKSQSQTSRVPNVWPYHWLSKRRSKTKKVTSQSWAPLDAHYGWASFVADRPSTNARQRISVDGRSPYHCLHATGHAFHWRRLAQNGTRGWQNGWGSIQTGLFGAARLQTRPFGLALPLNIQN